VIEKPDISLGLGAVFYFFLTHQGRYSMLNQSQQRSLAFTAASASVVTAGIPTGTGKKRGRGNKT